MASNILSEYLVKLGIKDDLSNKLKDILSKSSQEVNLFAKGFVIAGGAVASLLVAANTGIAKFATNLVKSDDELTKYAKSINKSKEEAFKLKTSLDAMGKSMDEIKKSAELTTVFKQLQRDAEGIKPPDMSEGLKQVKEIQTEFVRLKQSGSYAIQWVGHYLLKYLQQPMTKMKEIFGGLNDSVIKNMPKWSEKIASVMASFVRLGLTVIRGASAIFNAVKQIFDMIPKEIKIVGGALAALALFIRAGPIGKLITIISLALLLLEDFYTYLDGGDALLGGIWQKLIDIWKVLKDSGVLEAFRNGFVNALNLIVEKATAVIDILNKFGLTDKIIKGLLITFLGFKGVDIVTNKLNAFAKILGSISNTNKTGKIAGLSKAFGNVVKSIPKVPPFVLWIVGITALIGILALLFKNKEKVQEFINVIKEKTREFLNKLTEMLPELVRIGAEIVNFLIEGAMQILPQLIDAGIKILTFLIKGFIRTLPKIISTVLVLINKILSTLIQHLPMIVQAGINIIMALINGILSILPALIEATIQLVMAILDAIISNLPFIIEAGIQILLALINGIILILPQLTEAAINLIITIIKALVENLPTIIETGIKILIALINGIVKAIPKLVAAMPKIVKAILNGLKILSVELLKLGADLVRMLWEGILSMGSWIGGKVSGFFKDLFNKQKIEAEVETINANDPKPKPSPSPVSGGARGYADGGIVDKEQIAHIAEGNKPEAIIPLTKPNRARELLSGAMNYLGMDNKDKLSQKIAMLTQFTEKAYNKLNTLDAGLNQNSSYLYTTNNTATNYYNIEMPSNYTINDVSGRPEAISQAVDRTAQIRLRNLQGVLNT